jgi:hypothetical protein
MTVGVLLANLTGTIISICASSNPSFEETDTALARETYPPDTQPPLALL